MENFYDLTIKQIQAKVKEMEQLNDGVNLLVNTIFKLDENCWKVNGDPNDKWQNAINLNLKDKLELIKSFIITEYPERKLEIISREKAEFKKYVLEREKEIAEAFEALANREEKINNEIKNHLNKNNRKSIKTK
jgi:glutathione peroxidase-family protein